MEKVVKGEKIEGEKANEKRKKKKGGGGDRKHGFRERRKKREKTNSLFSRFTRFVGHTRDSQGNGAPPTLFKNGVVKWDIPRVFPAFRGPANEVTVAFCMDHKKRMGSRIEL